MCDYRPIKSDPYTVKLMVGDDRIEDPGDVSSTAASLMKSKLLFNSTILDALRGSRYLLGDLKYFSWKPQCQ